MSQSNTQRAEAAHQPLLPASYLRSLWSAEFESWRDSDEAAALLERLKSWAAKVQQRESTAVGTFIDVFFKQTWGYRASGQGDPTLGFTLHQEYPVKRAGQGGGTGQADIALGHFGIKDVVPVPQVFGEFKDDRSGLDKKQHRSNTRTPVEQCLDYLREARTGSVSKVQPNWAIVTDMNEFRLYMWGREAQYQRFVISPSVGDPAVSLLDDSDEAAFQRFVFRRLFAPDWLLADIGKSRLEKLVTEQLVHEKDLEAGFYREYQAYREHLYAALREANPDYAAEGRLRSLVKLTQRLLDRFIFVLYCEDMASQLSFPSNLLQDVLTEVSTSRFYHPDGTQAWDAIRSLFSTMRSGGQFGPHHIHRFNGGLFDADPEMDALRIPNRVFCAQNQGDSGEQILKHAKTLLFLSAKYNFGTTDDGSGKTLTLTAMGRIFEQSLTDLEVMEAKAAGRESLVEITRRKRNGVYYTPEWVTQYIVEQTIGRRLEEIRTELGFDDIGHVTDAQIADHRADGRKAAVVRGYERALRAYVERLDELKVLDPACGSGAFLIQAFIFLYEQRQWVAAELERVTGTRELFDTHGAMRAVLANNLYGVDLNAESVELTRLALWLHTALPGQPLTSLDHNIRCGNSLVGTDFAEQMGLDDPDPALLERVNPFDWQTAFPEVFEGDEPGFDCIIGNPPYVKLQNFRRVLAEQAEYLVDAKKPDGSPLYESTQTGNFDLYLPFIERGVGLLHGRGRLGYIAPSVWLTNEYGRGLRRFVARRSCLEAWVDFRSFQVFSDATTYTAAMFFGGSPIEKMSIVEAAAGPSALSGPAGVRSELAWDDVDEDKKWHFGTASRRALTERLAVGAEPLDQLATSISQGLISGAYWLYANEHVAKNRHLHRPNQKVVPADPRVVEIEDEATLRLASGEHIKRYAEVDTPVRLIFPYSKQDGTLLGPQEFASRHPKAWMHLSSYEQFLRSRDGGKLDDDEWYRFSRNQNLEKQGRPKILIAGTARSLLCTVDDEGAIAANDKRVYTVLAGSVETLWFLCGILNAPPASFVFRTIARPKNNGYFDIESQSLRPLPIPPSAAGARTQVASRAKTLQYLHTRERNLRAEQLRRLSSQQCEDESRHASWLWAHVGTPRGLVKDAPGDFGKREKTRWAKAEHARRLEAELSGLDVMLGEGAELEVVCDGSELRLLVNGVAAVTGIFLATDREAAFIAAQWRAALRDVNVTQAFDGKRLLKKLLSLRKTENEAIIDQVIALDEQILALDEEIEQAEFEINAIIYELYGLTDEEIALVEAG